MRRCHAVALSILTACGTDLATPGTTTPDGGDPGPGDSGQTTGSNGMPGPCDPANTHADFAYVQDNVFTPTCALGACHGAATVASLDLRTGAAYDALVTVASSTQSGWVRVVPGDPATSYLAVAIGGASGPPPKDGTMPLGAAALCGPKIDVIMRWIAAGAPK